MESLSSRVTADAGGGLKGPAQMRRSLRGFGGGGHQQAGAGIYRGIACRYLPLCKLPHVRHAQFCKLSPLKNVQIPDKIFLYKEMEDLLS